MLVERSPYHGPQGSFRLRVSTDFGNNTIKAKIQDAEQLRVHTPAISNWQ